MRNFTLALSAVAIGAAVVFLPVPAGWALAGGVLALGLGAVSLINIIREQN